MTPALVDGYVHEVGFYASDEEFADLILPFVHEGIETGEPVIFAYDEHKTNLLHDWLLDSAAVTYITDAGPYATPAKALGAWRALIQQRLADGARRVRIAGNVPHPGYGISYAGWDRYEAAVDHALGDLPVWAPCLYDARIAPVDVIERAKSLHHHFRERDGSRRANERYRPPSRLAEFLAAEADPLESTGPLFALANPVPQAARDAVRRALAGRLRTDRVDAVVVATSEAVTNALMHGVAPVSVRLWRDELRAVVRIHDCGPGPADPLAGLLALQGNGAESGRGLWIAHHLDIDVALIAGSDGFTVRLRVDLD
jgi:anti-sigma regulatory factor (Ser/Thr protein kinase)